MAKRRRSHRRTSTKLPHRVTFRKGGRKVVVFRHRKATAATKAKRRSAGHKLARKYRLVWRGGRVHLRLPSGKLKAIRQPHR